MSERRERLQKAIARTGFASRRKAEALISEGRLTVNGRVARLGDMVDADHDRIELDGALLPLRPDAVYYLLNKPAGIVSSTSDPHGRTTVTDLIDAGTRVWPVGRLDLETEGLLIVTNDGDLTQKLTHPRFGVEKRYRVLVAGSVPSPLLRRMTEGVELDDGPAAAVHAKVLERGRDRTLLEVVMKEGRKREVRRLCEALGLSVLHLFRSAIGPLEDTQLRVGEHRRLSASEVHELYRAGGVGPGVGEQVAVPWVIAVDGPGGAGKTTVSRAVAEELGLDHLDTGAFYRAATLVVLRDRLTPESAEALAAIEAGNFDFQGGRTILNGEDVTETIRGPDITAAVSQVSAVPEIRQVMVERQRRWVAKRGERAVVEGRDIGTVVVPFARLKVFLTASVEVRAARRAAQQPDLTDVASELDRRDRQDSTRATSPLMPAEDAVILDTSEMSFTAVVSELVRLARERGFS